MVISIVNHKGGTGKTTTTINMGSVLAASGYSVLLIDFDAQGSLSYSLGLGDVKESIGEALLGEVAVQEILYEREGMHVLAANTTLADVELAIAKSEERFNHLKQMLEDLSSYDFVLIDCPPSLSLLTLNALVASDHVLVPMQLDVLALRGLESMLNTVEKMKSINPGLSVLGILPMMADMRKNIHQEVRTYISENYDIPMFSQVIRSSVKAAEAPSFGKSVVSYAPTSTTSQDYQAFTREFLSVTHLITKK